MGGFTKMLIGLFWVGCGIYAYNVVNPDYPTELVGLSGLGIGLMVFIGILQVIMGIEKTQKGE